MGGAFNSNRQIKTNYMTTIENQQGSTQANVYPKPTSDGYFFENDTDEAMSIETTTHENGNQSKRIKLSDNRIAIVRELKGSEVEQTSRLHQGKEELAVMATATLATKINGEKVIMEELADMRGRDYNKIRTAVAQLNF